MAWLLLLTSQNYFKMRNLFLGLLIVLSTSLFCLPLPSSIVNALKSGNASELAKYMESSIDLSIPENEGIFSKAQSELILKTFFTKHHPNQFKVMNNGDSKNNTHYSIGTLDTSRGQFRVYILYKEVNNTVTILELRIESDD